VARIETHLSVTAPAEISVSLVRADHMGVSSIFRTLFEVALALFSALVGCVISNPKPDSLHWISLGVTGASACVFLGLSIWFSKRARSGN